ncbi:MAG: hypothetical protein ACXADB_11695, partial [Candidatus Hermodarchaeia archaeon]
TGAMLDILEYPRYDQGLNNPKPSLDVNLSDDLISAAIRMSRGSIRDRIKYAWTYLMSRRPINEKLQKGINYLIREEV